MKKLFTLLLLISCLMLKLQSQSDAITNTGFFTNPIFSGDYPDPSLLVDGDDYYVVHSSFEYYPGLTIWHSKDLINWTPIASALTHYVGSVWAPDLIKCDGKYYIYFPADNTNYVIVADAIDGTWSEPIDLKVGGIDPGHIVDDAGNRYLYFNNGGYVSLSTDGLSVTGDFQHSYDGWPIPRDWTVECFCMEGPKLFKRGSYYYLTVAQGGTAGPPTGHMVVSARSKSPLGPWENSPFNPIIRTQSATEKWCSVGHGTVFEGPNSKWWMIFHGYENGHYNMGRQTLLTPIEWTDDGWFKTPDNLNINEPIPHPLGQAVTNQFKSNNSFEGNTFHHQWKFFGEYAANRFELSNNSIAIKAKGQSVEESHPLLYIPSDHSYSAQVKIEIEGKAIGGLVLYYNHKAYSGILADNKNVLANLRGWQFPTEKNVINNHVYLKLKNIDHIVNMYYSLNGTDWIKIESSLEVSGYHHNVLSGFLSLRIGLVSMGEGNVTFKDFKYEPLK